MNNYRPLNTTSIKREDYNTPYYDNLRKEFEAEYLKIQTKEEYINFQKKWFPLPFGYGDITAAYIEHHDKLLKLGIIEKKPLNNI